MCPHVCCSFQGATPIGPVSEFPKIMSRSVCAAPSASGALDAAAEVAAAFGGGVPFFAFFAGLEPDVRICFRTLAFRRRRFISNFQFVSRQNRFVMAGPAIVAHGGRLIICDDRGANLLL